MDLVLWQRLRDEVLAFGTVCFDVKKKMKENWGFCKQYNFDFNLPQFCLIF